MEKRSRSGRTVKVVDYDRQVYAGVLGKVIGVYMGRPVEGWWRERIVERFGEELVGYVHEARGVPLVVSDDDITGTFTFVRALEDSGLYADTPPEFFGQTWLNYLIVGETILWWGGMGISTEHTAFLRLQQGHPSPRSGSAALNGTLVAEQIGGQIFIDAFGMVAPGRPELAARLARHAASVSHDGEAVHAAVVVATMVSAAFVEKDMDRLLDIGASFIPPDSTIAAVHRDVRRWARTDRDWRKTYDRIRARYGPDRHGGFCHVVNNHALMVMAWAHAPDDFYQSQMIVNSAGWDTDCNAANVGSVMGVLLGLDGLCARYDFRSPFADRLILPTAEGTRTVSDCLNEALAVARIGRRIMDWPQLPPPKGGAIHHFSMPGALHGYMSEDGAFDSRGAADVSHVMVSPDAACGEMQIAFRVGPGRTARISTPLCLAETKTGSASYRNACVPRLFPGMKVAVDGVAGALEGVVQVRLFVRLMTVPPAMDDRRVYAEPMRLAPGRSFRIAWRIPDLGGLPVQVLGIEFASAEAASGLVRVRSVAFSGMPEIQYPDPLPEVPTGDGRELVRLPGWLVDADRSCGKFDGKVEAKYFVKNRGQGLVVTGTTDWDDYRFSARVRVPMADRAGIVARYQGTQRWLALVKAGHRLQLILRQYDETLLAETDCPWTPEEFHVLALVLKGPRVTALCDGKPILRGEDRVLGRGGAGFLFENGMIGFREIRVAPWNGKGAAQRHEATAGKED
jgi:ADP-ribosylglycohydrolase